MSKANVLAKKFLSLRKTERTSSDRAVMPHNSFRAMFDPHELKKEELEKLKSIFSEAGADEEREESREDFRHLLQLTSELKAIQKQAVLLIGERVFRVREIFQSYGGEGVAFTHWLNLTFNSRKTAYNALAYYELYRALPSEELKQKLKTMPVKVGYVLASRKAEERVKQGIIEKYQGERQEEMLHLIDEQLPVLQDRRSPKSLGERTAVDFEKLVDRIIRRKSVLTKQDKRAIQKAIAKLETYL